MAEPIQTCENIEGAQDQATEWLWTYKDKQPQHGHRRHDPRHETENSRVNFTAEPIKNKRIADCLPLESLPHRDIKQAVSLIVD